MRLGIVIPAIVQSRAALDLLMGSVARMGVSKQWCWDRKADYRVWIMANRLTQEVVTESRLGEDVGGTIGGPDSKRPTRVQVVNDRERTVGGAWNEGIRRAVVDGCQLVLLAASDARPHPGCIEALCDFGMGPRILPEEPVAADTYHARTQGVAVWSAVQEHQAKGRPEDRALTDGADFSLAMVYPHTIAAHGYFDENFKPAYYEDNDYYARVVLGGQRCRVVHAARYEHFGGGSQTIKTDAEMAHHVRHWFQSNLDYFRRKWGVQEPAGTERIVRARYNKTPFAVQGRPLSYWEIEHGRA